MVGQAAGFAVLAAISPTALIVMAVFLASANPRLIALAYVLGAFAMTIVMAIVVLYVLRATGFNLPRGHDPRYGLRLGLGVLTLAGALYIFRRKPPAPNPDKPRQGLMSRLISEPSARTAFAAGVLIFAPSTTFIAAVQVVATARAGVPITLLTIVIIVLITCMIVWLPWLAYLAAPEATTKWLKTVNDWLRAHGTTVMVDALSLAGIILVVNGALGLAGVLS